MPAHSWPIKFKQHRSLNSLNISKQHLAPMQEDEMHIIYDIKNKIASELPVIAQWL